MMNLAARRLQPLLLLSAALMCACRAQVTHTPEGGLEADEHLHQSQIPPPSKQPSEEEIKDAIATLIDESIDTNKDGTLSAEELKAWLNINHNKIMDENINRQWNYYKPNVQEVHSWEGYEPAQKEVLQWDQYKDLTYPDEYLKDDPSNPHFKSMSIMYKRSEKRWALADANSDGVLIKEEFKDFIHPEESVKIKDVLVDEAMDDFDADKNGAVSLEEFMAHMTDMTEESDRNEPGWEQGQQSQFSTYLDKDKDGSLSRDELRDWLIPPYDKHEAEAWRLVTLGDEDKDSALSKEEVLALYQQFYVLLPPDFWAKFMPDESQQHDEL